MNRIIIARRRTTRSYWSKVTRCCVFLSRDEADVDSPYRLVRSDGLFTVTDGVISGGEAGPLLDALAGRTVDDVAELIGT